MNGRCWSQPCSLHGRRRSSAAAATCHRRHRQAKKRPNVLLLLTDDIGMDQLQLYGYNSVPLGSGDAQPRGRCRAAGLTFRNAWTMPACSTARGVLYTGRYPFRTELQAALGPYDLANSMISPYERTIPKLMSKAGYATALFGKFHVGLQGNNPFQLGMVNALGWDYYNGWLDETGDPSSHRHHGGPRRWLRRASIPTAMCRARANGGADSGACYNAAGELHASDDRPPASKNPAGRACRDDGGIFVPNAACTTPMPSNLDFQTLSAHYVSPLVISHDRAVPMRCRPPTSAPAPSATSSRPMRRSRGSSSSRGSASRGSRPSRRPPCTRRCRCRRSSTLPADAPDGNGVDLGTTEGTHPGRQPDDPGHGSRSSAACSLSTGLATKEDDQLVLTAASANTVVIYVNDNGSLGSQVRLPFDPHPLQGHALPDRRVDADGDRRCPSSTEQCRARTSTRMVNIADLYELIGNVGGIDVRKNNPRRSIPCRCSPISRDINQPSIRDYDFTLVGPNLQANGGMNGPCQFPGSSPPSCSQIPVTKGVCEDNGGTWFGTGPPAHHHVYHDRSTVTMPIPSDGFHVLLPGAAVHASRTMAALPAPSSRPPAWRCATS